MAVSGYKCFSSEYISVRAVIVAAVGSQPLFLARTPLCAVSEEGMSTCFPWQHIHIIGSW